MLHHQGQVGHGHFTWPILREAILALPWPLEVEFSFPQSTVIVASIVLLCLQIENSLEFCLILNIYICTFALHHFPNWHAANWIHWSDQFLAISACQLIPNEWSSANAVVLRDEEGTQGWIGNDNQIGVGFGFGVSTFFVHPRPFLKLAMNQAPVGRLIGEGWPKLFAQGICHQQERWPSL